MRTARYPIAALGGLILPLAACSHGATAPAPAPAFDSGAAPAVASAPLRATPTRPGIVYEPIGVPVVLKAPPALAGTRFRGVDYVAATEIGEKLGMKSLWDARRKELTLTAGTRTLTLAAEKREVAYEGLRIFLGESVQLRSGQLYVSRTDYDRCLLPLLRPDLIGGVVPRVRTIVLDPGHGGSDPGMESKSLHLQEKTLALDVALRLEKILKAEGYTVVLTRRDDEQLAPSKDADLQRRALIANTALADLFLSIHFNSLYPDTKVSGTEVYVFTRPGQRSDPSLAAGQVDDSEREPSPVNRQDAWTTLFAHAVHRETIAGLKTDDRGHKTKHLAVLRGLNCPGVLVESLFISNAAEARRAATPAYRQKIAESLATGIRSYTATLASLPPKSPPTSGPGARPASPNSP